MIETPIKPTAKPLTFSIKSVLVLTVAVAMWLVVYRANFELAMLLLGPMVFVAVAFYFRKTQALFWLPVLTLVCFFALGYLGNSYLYDAEFMLIILLTSLMSVAAATIPRVREKFKMKASVDWIIFYTLKIASVAGVLVGLSIAISLMAIGTALNLFSQTSMVGLFGLFIFPLFGGIFGALVAIPLAFVTDVIVHCELRMQETEHGNDRH